MIRRNRIKHKWRECNIRSCRECINFQNGNQKNFVIRSTLHVPKSKTKTQSKTQQNQKQSKKHSSIVCCIFLQLRVWEKWTFLLLLTPFLEVLCCHQPFWIYALFRGVYVYPKNHIMHIFEYYISYNIVYIFLRDVLCTWE